MVELILPATMRIFFVDASILGGFRLVGKISMEISWRVYPATGEYAQRLPCNALC